MMVTLIMRDGRPPSEAPGKPLLTGPDPVQETVDGLSISRNVAVRMRDGIRILIDIYRPEGWESGAPMPVIVGWSPYGKHHTRDHLMWPEADVEQGWISSHTAFEAPDPAYWCPRGYAVVYPDPRGTWLSEGDMSHGGPQESEDCYDLVEWLGEEPWSNGKVGFSGVSYLACIQWQVGPLRPPHLAALNPWEGFSDWYREFGYHGGIPETGFIPRADSNLLWSTTRTESTAANFAAHPLYDEYWQSKENPLELIETPIFIVASWTDQGFHTRGTLEAYKRIGSPNKWLEIHGDKKWRHYYDPASVARLSQFFDHFLLGTDRAVLSWPKVRIQVRESAGVATWRDENQWPLERTLHKPMYVDLAAGTLNEQPSTTAGERTFDTAADEIHLDHRFDEDTELTGHMKLRLWVEAADCDDADLFVGIRKLDQNGVEVPFTFYAVYDDGPAALGWLRLSHRELDRSRSRPEQPWHRHTHEQPLSHGVPVPIDVEIWPSSVLYREGETLRVVIRGSDLYVPVPPTTPRCLHEQTRNGGRLVIRAGGTYDSHLLVPLVRTSEAT